MPELAITPVYRLDELTLCAQEVARAWYRRHTVPEDDGFVIEDFERVCEIIGVDLATRGVRLYGGGTRSEPRILYSGFSSQGDGASFEGTYRYANGSLARIRDYAPDDRALHLIVDTLAAIQRRNFYQLAATIRQQGRSCHEYTMTIAVERTAPTCQDMTADAEDQVAEGLRDLARWLYRRLESEYDYQMADAQVDEALRDNDYTFTEAGVRIP